MEPVISEVNLMVVLLVVLMVKLFLGTSMKMMITMGNKNVIRLELMTRTWTRTPMPKQVRTMGNYKERELGRWRDDD